MIIKNNISLDQKAKLELSDGSYALKNFYLARTTTTHIRPKNNFFNNSKHQFSHNFNNNKGLEIEFGIFQFFDMFLKKNLKEFERQVVDTES